MKKYLLLLILVSVASAIIIISKVKSRIHLAEPEVIINPFSVNPLTALIKVHHDELKPEDVESMRIKVLGKSYKQGKKGVDIEATLYPRSKEFKMNFFDITKHKVYNDLIITDTQGIEIPVLGLYPDFNNTVEYKIITKSSIYLGNVNIQTDTLPDRSFKINVNKVLPKKMEEGDVTWMTADEFQYDVMFDHFGEIRWIINVEGNSDLRVLRNGNLLIRSWWYERNFGEYTRMGESVQSWKLPGGFANHHNIIELPNGNFLILVTRLSKRKEGYKSVEDCILEIDRKSSKVLNYWDLFEIMDISNLEEVWTHKPVEGPGDWFHMNSICYDEFRDAIIVSGKHGGVIKLTRNGENGFEVNADKDIVWYMPMHDQYSLYANHQATKNYILVAVDPSGNAYEDQTLRHPDFHWMKYQHDPTITLSEDSLVKFLIFDNVHEPQRSSIVEYLVDEGSSTVREVWQYGKDRPELFSPAWSGATWLTSTDNRLMITAFWHNPKVEVTKRGKVVFEFRASTKNADPRWYRGGRMNLYPEGNPDTENKILSRFVKVILFILLTFILLYGWKKATQIKMSKKN